MAPINVYNSSSSSSIRYVRTRYDAIRTFVLRTRLLLYTSVPDFYSLLLAGLRGIYPWNKYLSGYSSSTGVTAVLDIIRTAAAAVDTAPLVVMTVNQRDLHRHRLFDDTRANLANRGQ